MTLHMSLPSCISPIADLWAAPHKAIVGRYSRIQIWELRAGALGDATVSEGLTVI
jgi:hypothetical protein